MIVVTSLENEKVKKFKKLQKKKYRDEYNQYIIEGEHLISMAKDIECIFTTNENYKNDATTVYYVNEAILRILDYYIDTFNKDSNILINQSNLDLSTHIQNILLKVK